MSPEGAIDESGRRYQYQEVLLMKVWNGLLRKVRNIL
jgi:hypothetical protein